MKNKKYDTYLQKLLKDLSGGNPYEYLYYREPKIGEIYFLLDSINNYFFYRAVWDFVKYK